MSRSKRSERLWSIAAATVLGACGARAESPPNFVFILGEGHGWSSTSVQMDDAVAGSKSRYARTPNLEKLSADGLRMAQFYAPSPRCTPSRAALLTGRSPAALHMTFVHGDPDKGKTGEAKLATPVGVYELPRAETTIPEALKTAGYATAHFGKWHLGRVDPKEHGFDESDGPNDNGGPENVENPHPKQLAAMTDKGIDFVTRQAKAGKPFYLQLSHYASRMGASASPEALAAVEKWNLRANPAEKSQAATTYDLDLALGRLLARLDELKLAANTYVIFTTDHGTPGRNPPLAGGKGTVSEGGLRVPFIVRGPGIKAGTCSHVRAIGQDLLPTVWSLAKLKGEWAKTVEGGSLADAWLKGDTAIKRPREELVFHFPHYDKDTVGPASAIVAGDYKLVHVYETSTIELYNLAKDLGERQDLSAAMPDKAKELDGKLMAYLKAVNAQFPTPRSKP